MISHLSKAGFCAVLAAAVWMGTPAIAHEYEELDPLDENTRSFLITLLEDAGSIDRLDGTPDALNEAGTKLSARLVAVIENADTQDMEWLATADYAELEHPAFGRVPSGMLLQLFSDLAGEIAHAEEHADDEDHIGLSFETDLKRLRDLSDQVWGQ